jgi:predicted enzyme related to lactoylglutathione lyase
VAKLIAGSDEFRALAGLQMQSAVSARARHPVVHLELQTGNMPRACAFYSRLFGWTPEQVHTSAGNYQAVDMGGLSGGVVECEADRAAWLPYVEVDDVAAVTDHAVSLGAGVVLTPREGPAGWRSVIVAPAGAAIALWQPKPHLLPGGSLGRSGHPRTKDERNTR